MTYMESEESYKDNILRLERESSTPLVPEVFLTKLDDLDEELAGLKAHLESEKVDCTDAIKKRKFDAGLRKIDEAKFLVKAFRFDKTEMPLAYKHFLEAISSESTLRSLPSFFLEAAFTEFDHYKDVVKQAKAVKKDVITVTKKLQKSLKAFVRLDLDALDPEPPDISKEIESLTTLSNKLEGWEIGYYFWLRPALNANGQPNKDSKEINLSDRVRLLISKLYSLNVEIDKDIQKAVASVVTVILQARFDDRDKHVTDDVVLQIYNLMKEKQARGFKLNIKNVEVVREPKDF